MNGFEIRKPFEGCSFKNYLSNGQYGMRLDQMGSGYSVTLDKTVKDGRCFVSHHGGNLSPKGRYAYCLDRADGALWNPSFAPTKTPLDEYVCRHGFCGTGFRGTRNGISCESRNFLPRRGRFELWLITVTNRDSVRRSVTLYAQMEFLLQSAYPVDYPYYSWYTDSFYDASRGLLEIFSRKPAERNMLGFCKSVVPPDGYDASLTSFFGRGDERRPESVFSPASSCAPSAGDPPSAAFRYDLELEPGEAWTAALMIGEGSDSLEDAELRFGSLSAVESEWNAALVQRQEELRSQGFFSALSRSAERKIADPTERLWFMNNLPYQIRQQSLGMIRFEYCGYRDVAQDAIGMSHYDLASSRRLILDLAGMQHGDGRCLRQANTMGAPHDERDFRDLPFWLVLAVARYCIAGGDRKILYEQCRYLEGGESESVLGHIARGLRYVLRFGPHDLLEIGVGDWNDALSAFGKKGESLWLNEIAYLCMDCLDELLDSKGDRDLLGFDIASMRDRLYDAVIAGWTGEWFLRGYSEDGLVVGGQDRIFLLPQAWFTISGMARRDSEKARLALDAMVKRLDHPDGLLKCHPAFTEYEPSVGNLSALTPGVAENFAVYNHASAFGIDALYIAGREEEARRYLERLLPFTKDVERTRAEPYVLVNYYNGGYYPGHAGRGGISWMTGTANWLAMILFDFILPESRNSLPYCNFLRQPIGLKN